MIYFGLAIVLLLCFWIEYNSGYGSNITKVLFGICSLLFLALFALRGTHVGGDMIQYVRFFTGTRSYLYGTLQNNTLEVGFVYFCKFLHLFNDSAFFFIFCTALFSTIPFIILVSRHSRYKILSLLYVISSNFAIMIVNIETSIRQNIASAFLMLALVFFLEKERIKGWYWYSLPLLLASLLTHTSMYIIVPIGILLYIIPFNKKISILLLFVSYMMPLVIDTSFFTNLFHSSGTLLSGFENFNNITRYTATSHNKAVDAVRIIKFTENAPSTLWAIYNIWICSKNEANNYFMKNLVVGMIILNLGGFFFLSFRFAYLFIMLGYCYIPLKFSKKGPAMLINILIVLVLLFRLYTYVTNASNFNQDNHALPYEFIS